MLFSLAFKHAAIFYVCVWSEIRWKSRDIDYESVIAGQTPARKQGAIGMQKTEFLTSYINLMAMPLCLTKLRGNFLRGIAHNFCMD